MSDFLRILPFLQDVRYRAGEEQAKPVDVDLTLVPEFPVVQLPTNLKLAFRRGTEPVKLTLSHDRILHAVIVSDSFDSFVHIHPEDFGLSTENIDAGTFDLQYAFPHGGSYLVAIDYMVEEEHMTSKFLVEVQGKSTEHTHDFSLQKNFGAYTVALEAPKMVRANQDTVLRYHITREKEDIEDLEPYLAAPMHIALIRDDFRSFMHTHGHLPGHAEHGHHGEGLPEKFGPVIEVPVRFQKPGIHHIFGEFQHNGKPVLTHFMINVK